MEVLNGTDSTINSAEISQGALGNASLAQCVSRDTSNHNSIENHKKTVYNAPQRNRSVPGHPQREQVSLFV